MRAIILAGGKGRRLYPYTAVLPKPLIPIGDMPIVDIVLQQLSRCGFHRVTLAVGYQAEIIMAVLGDGARWNLSLDYSLENQPLSTIGPLRLVDGLDEPFLVMNGDLLTDLDYRRFYQAHLDSGAIATIATCKHNVQLALGVLEYDRHNRLTAFREKPSMSFDVSMGVYAFRPEIRNHIPPGVPFGFDQLMETLLAAGEPVNLYPFDGYWLDMGTHEDLDRAMKEFETHRSRFLPE